MRLVWVLVVAAGLAGAALGGMWFLQGSDLLHIDPILCAGSCEPLVGHQPVWQAVGAVTVALGALAIAMAVRRLRR